MPARLLEIEMALRAAERSLASALRRLTQIKTTCPRCGEPLTPGQEGLCPFCTRQIRKPERVA